MLGSAQALRGLKSTFRTGVLNDCDRIGWQCQLARMLNRTLASEQALAPPFRHFPRKGRFTQIAHNFESAAAQRQNVTLFIGLYVDRFQAPVHQVGVQMAQRNQLSVPFENGAVRLLLYLIPVQF